MKKYLLITAILMFNQLAMADSFDLDADEESHLRSANVQSFDRDSVESGWVKSMAHHSQLMSHGHRTQKAILIMHGLFESPFYMQNFAEYFFNHGYNVYSLLLPGHQSKDKEALSKVKFTEWIAAAEQGLKITQDLGDQVEVLGYSTGGTLAMYLALEHAEQIKKIYLISPALTLSFKVYIGSLLLGRTKISSDKICKNADSKNTICKALEISDQQIKPMLKEGLASSLATGREVRMLISFIAKKFQTFQEFSVASNYNFYSNLTDIYLKLKIPMLMVGSASDNVVNANFNNEFAEKYQGVKENIFFKKELKISHISITKTALHGFQNVPEVYNPEFAQILNGIDKIMNYEAVAP
jgi:alpha-beta hydrolase superfamily lysophospholipase